MAFVGEEVLTERVASGDVGDGDVEDMIMVGGRCGGVRWWGFWRRREGVEEGCGV